LLSAIRSLTPRIECDHYSISNVAYQVQRTPRPLAMRRALTLHRYTVAVPGFRLNRASTSRSLRLTSIGTLWHLTPHSGEFTFENPSCG